jgi:hypothetical protein
VTVEDPSGYVELRRASDGVLRAGGIELARQAVSGDQVTIRVITPQDLAWLQVMRNVEIWWLDLTEAGITDATAAALKNVPPVSRLSLSGNRITGSALHSLRYSPRLLGLEQMDLLTEVSFIGALDELERLESVALDFSPISSDGLRGIGVLPNLRWLGLAWTDIDNSTASDLRAMHRLEFLQLTFCKISDDFVSDLGPHPALQHLNLGVTAITGNACESIGRWKSLRLLDLAGTSLTTDDIARIGLLPNLERLVLRNTSVDDSIIDLLDQFPRLESLDIADTDVTSEGEFILDVRRPGVLQSYPGPLVRLPESGDRPRIFGNDRDEGPGAMYELIAEALEDFLAGDGGDGSDPACD